VQTCNRCHTGSPDTALRCVNCGADLSRESESAVARSRLQANPRVYRIRLVVHEDACPSCRSAEGEFAKSEVPVVPLHGCSHALGCRCFYEPALSEIFP
jgi:hypothetical protein